ncbi:hypothetical protein BLNAU_327 [Blattamonas nauphoetae]|uniref:Ubiquitin-like domain-containing protein n=1 Tax=Blattamonas nauphoetae TaxID=2049346 RepID=A0ABQ9YKX2_9EUKA|nr:hypothetical protein BLNAU_327 [Blattamonas nauphoetae]
MSLSIILSSFDGITHHVQVELTQNVLEIKRLAEPLFEIPANSQILFFNSTMLENPQTLHRTNLYDGATVLVTGTKNQSKYRPSNQNMQSSPTQNASSLPSEKYEEIIFPYTIPIYQKSIIEFAQTETGKNLLNRSFVWDPSETDHSFKQFNRMIGEEVMKAPGVDVVKTNSQLVARQFQTMLSQSFLNMGMAAQ